jgi:mannose-6-phosphate isomerase-like protein (cupin superfamily)
LSHFTLIASGIDVEPLLAELDAHPEVWNHRPERRAGDSPHRETSDVWVRFASPEAMCEPGFTEKPHESVWWPAYRLLPSLTDIIMTVMDAIGGEMELGGILITRIGPEKRVFPHHDNIAWHARYYSTKVWIVLRGNDKCVNTVEDEEMVWEPGCAYSHNNLIRHSVRNGGETERIVLILCFRKQG